MGLELVGDVDVVDDGSWEVMPPVFADSCVQTGFLTSASPTAAVSNKSNRLVLSLVPASVSFVTGLSRGRLGYMAHLTRVDVRSLIFHFSLN